MDIDKLARRKENQLKAHQERMALIKKRHEEKIASFGGLLTDKQIRSMNNKLQNRLLREEEAFRRRYNK